jgi:Na+/proline symporter
MVRHRSSGRGARRAAAVLAVLAGCAAALAGLAVLFSTTESPTDGPAGIVLVLGLLALPVVVAAVLVARILAGGAGREDERFLP